MNRRRLLLISKRFWPMSGQTELLSAAFAEQLTRLECQVDIITWRIVKQWPEQFQFGICNVIRLPQSQRAAWSRATLGYYGRNRWQRSLQRWVTAHKDDYDAAFVFEFEEDALAPTIIVGRSGIPLVSRTHRQHMEGLTRQTTRDLQSVLKNSGARLVTPDRVPMSDTLTRVPDGWPNDEDEALTRQHARAVLAKAHPIFQTEATSLLAVCGADLTFESGVFSLVRAWRQVLAAYPAAKLWLIGCGRNSAELYQRICDLDMQNSVLLTGNFDEIRDVLAAANAYIMPGRDEAAGWYSNSALQLGLPVIHHQQSPDAQVFLETACSIPFDDESRSIDLVVERWAASESGPDSFDEFDSRDGFGSRDETDSPDRQQRNGCEQQVSMQTMAENYLAMVEQLVSEKT